MYYCYIIPISLRSIKSSLLNFNEGSFLSLNYLSYQVDFKIKSLSVYAFSIQTLLMSSLQIKHNFKINTHASCHFGDFLQ